MTSWVGTFLEEYDEKHGIKPTKSRSIADATIFNEDQYSHFVLEKKDSVLSIKEALLKFDKKTEEPYVEVKMADGQFEKIILKLGTSDGVNIEVLEGITLEDEIKIWNKASKDDKEKDNDF